jgi:hypothetical protein
MSKLLSGKGGELIGKPITLHHVKVVAVTRSREIPPKSMGVPHVQAFWIGNSDKELSGKPSVLVILENGLTPVNSANDTAAVKTGDTADITGTVEAVPDQTQLRALYALSDTDIGHVEQERVVVKAGSVVIRNE